MIWHAVRMACSSWSRRISATWRTWRRSSGESRPPKGADLAHLDRVPIQSGENAMQTRDVATLDQRLPSLQVPLVRLALHATAQAAQVASQRRPPLLKPRCGRETSRAGGEAAKNVAPTGQARGRQAGAQPQDAGPCTTAVGRAARRSSRSCRTASELMLGWCTPLSRDSSDWVVPVSTITSRSSSPRFVHGENYSTVCYNYRKTLRRAWGSAPGLRGQPVLAGGGLNAPGAGQSRLSYRGRAGGGGPRPSASGRPGRSCRSG